MLNIIPRPASIIPAEGTFILGAQTAILVPKGIDEIRAIGQYLADQLRPVTGFPLPVQAEAGKSPRGNISLALNVSDTPLGEEGYELSIQPDRVTLTANRPAGLFHGVQTLRQMLPASIEMLTRLPGPWKMDAVAIHDQPRFPWRGAMLDVARHFFKPAAVKRFIDQLALYKFNVLHLHLTDDQGWRLKIGSWPNLTEVGGSTAVNHDPAGYYTQEEYRDIVTYAAERYITIVPEVDMPGHTNAALASYAELNQSEEPPALYTGTEVGFSSFSIQYDATYKFLEDVVREIAALTPGPYFHIGGDEAHSTPDADYIYFVKRVQDIVKAQGKICIGWEEIAKSELLPDTVVQYWWNKVWAQKGAAQGRKFVMSPAEYAYMDIKYDASTKLGQDWTKKYIEVRDAYEWDPLTVLEGVNESAVLGVEAPLWSETTVTTDDLDYMIFPRLPGYAEIGWTPVQKRNWEEYRQRLAAHGPRLAAMGVKFYRSPQVAWE
jgi:hexosaminidase